MRTTFILMVLLLCSRMLFSKNTLFVPLNIQQAIKHGTRSEDGRPGPDYWINHTDYTIQVDLNPRTRLLKGHEIFTYFNNSPDTLRHLVLRIYQDNRKLGNARDWPIDPSDLHEGVDIDQLKIGGQDYSMEGEKSRVERTGTNMFIKLRDPLSPGSHISGEVAWQYIISRKSNIRNGAYDSTSIFVGYWYPQVAVYDDIDGWDGYNYSGVQEFYNDFNNYDVKITVPQGFMVWSTGILQNADAVLAEKIAKRYKRGLQSDEIEHIISEKDYTKSDRLTAPGPLVWHFKAEQVPDVAFATSNHYLWDMTGTVVDSAGRNRVVISAVYKSADKNFHNVAQIAKESIDYYSKELPGVPFPFPRLTVFDGKGGMEYPMMVNEGASSRWAGTVHVTSHEICHSYFPFFMGINERKYAWMDEGWATVIPYDLQSRLSTGYDPVKRTIITYESVAGSEMDLPMIVPTIVYGSNSFRPSYRNEAYNRSGTAYLMLQDLFGKKLFKKALKEYINRWHGKHPGPFDFFNTFSEVSGRNLDWFWKPWFFDFGYPDLGIEDVIQKKNKVIILIKKVGELPIPVHLILIYSDGSEQTIDRNLDGWSSGQAGIMLTVSTKKKVKSVKLSSPHIPDVNTENNIFKINQ